MGLAQNSITGAARACCTALGGIKEPLIGPVLLLCYRRGTVLRPMLSNTWNMSSVAKSKLWPGMVWCWTSTINIDTRRTLDRLSYLMLSLGSCIHTTTLGLWREDTGDTRGGRAKVVWPMSLSAVVSRSIDATIGKDHVISKTSVIHVTSLIMVEP
jgi:hypothetical protein